MVTILFAQKTYPWKLVNYRINEMWEGKVEKSDIPCKNRFYNGKIYIEFPRCTTSQLYNILLISCFNVNHIKMKWIFKNRHRNNTTQTILVLIKANWYLLHFAISLIILLFIPKTILPCRNTTTFEKKKCSFEELQSQNVSTQMTKSHSSKVPESNYKEVVLTYVCSIRGRNM